MNDAREEIRNRLAIEDVIGEYVELRRAGRYFKALSPFTHEHTPSFIVTPDRNIWHDFSSGQGGDIFKFVMLAEGVSFPEAMEILARKAGVDLSKYDTRHRKGLAELKAKQIEMNTTAMNYFQRQLINNKLALEYARQRRQLSPETILKWGIGYAPPRHQLKSLLMSKGYQRDNIKAAGLNIFEDYSFKGEGEGYHGGNRLMIPLRDSQGQVVGFTGRILDDHQPKYLNTPATAVYDKGRQLFGLNFARDTIRAKGYVIVVEGNMDVMTSSQAGIGNIVAVAGTALTTYHLKSLGRLTRDIRFCFDSDAAGVKATERAIALAGPLNLNLSVIDYSKADVKDPDELIKKDVAAWEKLSNTNTPAVDWVLERYKSQNDLSTAEGKKIVTSKALAVVKNLTDPVEVEFYLKKIASLTDTSVETLSRKLAGTPEPTAPPRRHAVKITLKPASRHTTDYYLNLIFAIALKNQINRPLVAKIPDSYLSTPFIQLKQNLLGQGTPTSEANDLIAKLEMFSDAELPPHPDFTNLMLTSLNTLFKLQLQHQLDQLQTQFDQAFNSGSSDLTTLNTKLTTTRQTLTKLERSNVSNDFAGLRDLWQQQG